MTGEKDMQKLIAGMNPKLNEGEYVFCHIDDFGKIERKHTLCEFKEQEGITVIVERLKADELGLEYDFAASWITLMVHSSLNAVGLIAIFSAELAKNNIACNVVSCFHHDHIFVSTTDSHRALRILSDLSERQLLDEDLASPQVS